MLSVALSCSGNSTKNMYSVGSNEKSDLDYINNIQPQAQAMAHAKNIDQGLINSDRAQVLKGLQQLDRIDINNISNPRIIMEKILDAITGKAVQWENYGIKRQIARQLRNSTYTGCTKSPNRRKEEYTKTTKRLS